MKVLTIGDQLAILKWGQDHDMITDANDLGDAVKNIMASLKEIVLNKYKIQHRKDGRCYTNFYEEVNGSRVRKQIIKPTENDLIEALMDYERGLRQETRAKPLTLESLFPKWIASKELESPSKNNAHRLRADWKRYYEGDPITHIDIRNISIQEWREWKLQKIRDDHLTKHQKSNMNTVANGIYDYAILSGIPVQNTSRIAGQKISAHLTDVNEIAKPNDEQIFTIDEQKAAIEWLLHGKHKFKNREEAYYGLALNFFLGLRIGELSALQLNDFNQAKQTLAVWRQEISKYTEEWGRGGHEIVPYVKKHHNREIPVPSQAAEILRTILDHRCQNGISNEFLLCHDDGTRIEYTEFTSVMKDLCRQLKTPYKGTHCIRKTAISTIARRNLSLASAMAGHMSQQTTLDNYVFDLNSTSQATEQLTSIFSDVL